jgi:hypothetical protein
MVYVDQKQQQQRKTTMSYFTNCPIQMGNNLDSYATGRLYKRQEEQKEIQTTTKENQRYKKCKTIDDLKKDPRVEKGPWKEETGWWLHLVTDNGWGFFNEGETSIVHEKTIKELCWRMNNSIHFLVGEQQP